MQEQMDLDLVGSETHRMFADWLWKNQGRDHVAAFLKNYADNSITGLYVDLDRANELKVNGIQTKLAAIDELQRRLTTCCSQWSEFNSGPIKYGHDEFIVLALSVDPEGLGEVVREAVRDRPFILDLAAQQTSFNLTVSIGGGVALGEEYGADFIRRLKEGVEESKSCGRNRVTVIHAADYRPVAVQISRNQIDKLDSIMTERSVSTDTLIREAVDMLLLKHHM